MKHVKTMLWAAVLSLALSISAYAGDIQSPGIKQDPPPSPATCSNCETSSAESENLETSEFAVDLLLALLSFF